jgi:hypothetical protein
LKGDRHECALSESYYKNERGFRGHKSAIRGRKTIEWDLLRRATGWQHHRRQT